MLDERGWDVKRGNSSGRAPRPRGYNFGTNATTIHSNFSCVDIASETLSAEHSCTNQRGVKRKTALCAMLLLGSLAHLVLIQNMPIIFLNSKLVLQFPDSSRIYLLPTPAPSVGKQGILSCENFGGKLDQTCAIHPAKAEAQQEFHPNDSNKHRKRNTYRY